MEKEEVVEALEEVFVKACEQYKMRLFGSVTEIRELGETILAHKNGFDWELPKFISEGEKME